MTPDRRVERWIWAAPAVFLIHDSEEIATIVPWVQANRMKLPAIAQSIATITTQEVALAVGILFIGVLLAAAHGVSRARHGGRSILFLVIAGALIGNGVTHVMQAIYFGEYTPGLATAVLLVIPYGVMLGRALEASRLAGRRTWLGAIAAGAVIQVPIVVALLLAVRS